MDTGTEFKPYPDRPSVDPYDNSEDGFAAMGKPIPAARKSAALNAMREMIPDISTQVATQVIDRVVNCLERDDPYRASRECSEVLDVTGSYRLMAHLLTGPVN